MRQGLGGLAERVTASQMATVQRGLQDRE